MKFKSLSLGLFILQILVVFVISALFSKASFAAVKVCNVQRLEQQARFFNKNIDPELKVSIVVESCEVRLQGRNCQITPFNAYQVTTLPRLPDQALLRALKIQSFGRDPQGTGYILAIPKCAG